MTTRAGVPPTLRLAAWGVAVGLAALRIFAFRHSMNPDGLSYLDMARAFAAGDLHTALNPHWGPLYPALVGLAFAAVKPGPGLMFPIAHAVEFLLFLAALAAFDFLLQELLRAPDATEMNPASALDGSGGTGMPAYTPALAPALFSYAVFLYSALVLIDFRPVTPDFAVAASAFAAAGLLVRMRRTGTTVGAAVLLGVVLALGYYAKSVMFVLGFAFIGSLALLPAVPPAAGRSRPWAAMAVALVVFLALASALVIPISRTTGALTFGTAGKLAYAWEVNHVPYTNWQGDAHSHLRHPPRQVRTEPELYDYSAHLAGTYPPWSDPAYWNAGMATSIRPANQVAQLVRSTKFYFNLFVDSAGALATLALILTLGAALRGSLAVLVPSLLGLAVYWPVHVEARYVAPFLALLWVVPVAARRRSRSADAARLLGQTVTASALLLGTLVALDTVATVAGARDETPHAVAVAAALRRAGLTPGERVANIGHTRGENFGSSFESYWAYLDGLHIVAEIPEQRDVLCRDPALQDSVFGELAALGARAVVTRAIPATACTAGWQPIPHTDFYLHLLSPHAE